MTRTLFFDRRMGYHYSSYTGRLCRKPQTSGDCHPVSCSDSRSTQIGFFSNSLSREGGGLFHSVRLLAQTVCRAGYGAAVLAPADSYLEQDRPSWEMVSTFPYPRYRAGMAERQLIEYKPDVLHLNGLWLPHSRIVHAVSQRHRIPVLISPRGMLDAWSLGQGRLKKKLAGWLYEYRNLHDAACIHALCESEFEAIRAFGLVQPVALVPNGVVDPPPICDRQRWGWPYPEAWREHPVLLFLSRVHPKKGLVPLIHAWHKIAVSGTDWRLAIVGPDENDHIKDILALVQGYDLSTHITWMGPKYGVNRDACYHHATAFVLPSYSEGFPMAALEALSFGLPAVLSPACHLPDAVDAGAALLAEPTIDGIAGALQHLFGLTAARRVAMGRRGQELVSKFYTWDSIASRMIAVYEWLIAPESRDMPADILVN